MNIKDFTNLISKLKTAGADQVEMEMWLAVFPSLDTATQNTLVDNLATSLAVLKQLAVGKNN